MRLKSDELHYVPKRAKRLGSSQQEMPDDVDRSSVSFVYRCVLRLRSDSL